MKCKRANLARCRLPPIGPKEWQPNHPALWTACSRRNARSLCISPSQVALAVADSLGGVNAVLQAMAYSLAVGAPVLACPRCIDLWMHDCLICRGHFWLDRTWWAKLCEPPKPPRKR